MTWGEDKCPLEDDLRSIRAKMRQARAVLVASPVYVHDVSGLAKDWIDRLAHVCHRPEFAGKCAYLLVTVGGSPVGHAFGSLEVALSTWGFHVAGKAGLKIGALMTGDEASGFQPRAVDIARRLFIAIERRDFARPSFRSLMTFKIQQLAWRKAADRNSFDYAYWKRQG